MKVKTEDVEQSGALCHKFICRKKLQAVSTRAVIAGLKIISRKKKSSQVHKNIMCLSWACVFCDNT